MSDLDEELEDLDTPSGADVSDDFDDPKQTTAALTMEINKLRQKNEVLRQFNVRQKDRYKHEVKSFLSPLLEKYKDIQSENSFLRTQIKEISQKIATNPLLINKDSGEDLSPEMNALQTMQNALNERDKELAVLNKMVKNLEEDAHNSKKGAAELPAIKDLLKQKEQDLFKAEQEKRDLKNTVEAKDKLVEKYSKQNTELETNVYVLNKKVSEAPVVQAPSSLPSSSETSKINEYESKLRSANDQINNLNSRINSLEKQIAEYQEAMSSLEQELKEDDMLNGNGHSNGHTEVPASFNLAKEDDLLDTDLPSDEDLLAEDIQLDDLPLDDLDLDKKK